MEFALYSIYLVLSYSFTRYVTEQTNFHLRGKGLWLHHWILALVAMTVLMSMGIEDPWVWGIVTGVALEGLSRKNWRLKDDASKTTH